MPERITKDNVIDLVKAYNKQYTDKIKVNQSKENLMNNLRERLQTQCQHPVCLERVLQPEKINPKRPNEWNYNPVEWMTNLDIDDVLSQYERRFSHYRHLGTYCIDYDTKDMAGRCLAESVCNLNMITCVQNGISKVSVVFNLSKHYEPGSHWVALIVDTTNNEICYYNSGGRGPPRRIKTLMERLKKQLPNSSIRWNKHQHQKSTTECGMFVVHTIIQMIERPFDDVIKDKKLDDTFVFRLRDVLFQ